ncbi:MAG TPA: Rieske 2Fe-2S domain-containing protein [Gaiellales bacterium]|jgi:ubiquinol-cytochrome c reductase iron-sulfur subunit
MKRLGSWLVVLVAVLWGRRRRDREQSDDSDEARVVAPAQPQPRTELAVIVLLLGSALAAVGFVVIYAADGLGNRTQLFGVALFLSLGFAATALIVLGTHLVSSEETEEDYPELDHPAARDAVAQIVHESGEAFTRKRLLIAAGGAAGVALGAAAITPALSLGPWTNTASLYDTPWKAGRRLVDENGRPLLADDIARETFYTAFPEDAAKDEIGSPLVLVRLALGALRLPPERATWAPDGIVAYSKICTHAGCAISLYRSPLFQPAEPRPGLVCPCHYSTFDPSDGGSVLFGPAGRDLPQLPLRVDTAGHLRASGTFSGPVGPSWQGVRAKRPT